VSPPSLTRIPKLDVRIMRSFCVAAAALTAAAASAPLDFIQAQANATLRQIASVKGANVYPSNGQPGVYGWGLSSASSWTAGFFPATLFKLSNLTSATDAGLSAFYYASAANLTAGLAANQFNTGTHDVGFIMFYTYGQMLALKGDPLAKTTLLNTAASLATRFVPVVGCTRSWNSAAALNEVLVIADNLMNLELLWWAGKQGNETFTQMATSHAELVQPPCIHCAKNPLHDP
jgi:unsaturated chondroitin disaccharide hydrolase